MYVCMQVTHYGLTFELTALPWYIGLFGARLLSCLAIGPRCILSTVREGLVCAGEFWRTAASGMPGPKYLDDIVAAGPSRIALFVALQ